MANPLHRLGEHGQSVWLDYISRELVTTDQLDGLIGSDNVSGLTSNPTIFEKAIGHGDAYDQQLTDLVTAGVTSPDDLFVELAVSDIQRAADILRPIYDRTAGGDGFVSLEVSPALAHDTDGTVAAAKYLWGRVERPNLMIKVPATPAGIPAVEELIAAGLNINVTLIFALSAYEAVAEAYIRGLERRAAAGEPLGNRSVASFFVSRVDTAVDRLLEESMASGRGDLALAESLLGKAAIANAVLAYERFEQIFMGTDRFVSLQGKGAFPQRPLWASTSAKNPRYRDVIYAEALVGPETVDTMPLPTIEAFADHGIVADGSDPIKADYPGAHEVMDRLRTAGVDMDAVTQQLLDEGVESFAASYTSLIRTIAEKADTMRGGLGTRQRLELGPTTTLVLAEAENLAAGGVVRRIWDRDPDLWKAGDAAHAKVIANRMGWLTVAQTMRERVPELLGLATAVRDEGVRDVVLLGMGGSSLAPELFRTSFGSAAGYPTLHVLDTTDPATIRDITDRLDPKRSLFIVSSKSGGTVETLSHMAHFWELVRGAGVADPGHAFVTVTDPGTSLAATARERGFRHVFENPPDIGGRYSALSYFGLVPAALAGIDVGRVLDRAVAMMRQLSPGTYPTLNVGLVLGTALGLLHDAGRDKVTILAPGVVGAFSLWAEQLIAESTGKEGKGIIPIGSEPLGGPAVYGDDRVFVALRLREDPGLDAAVGSLQTAGMPVITAELGDLYDLGGEFLRWEFATAVAGAHLGIDPFDEPNVTESKDNTNALLRTFETEGRLPPSEDAPPTAERLAEVLKEVRPGDYVAFQAYVTPGPDNEAALQELRVAVRDELKVATTLGFGPRFLHSTGQLHKGGPNTVVAVQIVVDDSVDVSIPGRTFTFSTLKRAQADGDLKSLRDHGRRVVRLHVTEADRLVPILHDLAASVRPTVGAR